MFPSACSIVEKTPGDYTSLDVPASKAYFLGAPANQNLLPNFNGCIRDLTVDGYEPIAIAWAGINRDFIITGKSTMRVCSASDE